MDEVFTFRIGSASIAAFVAADGYKWSQKDLHDEASGRTLDGVMHVVRIGSKDQLDITCRPCSATEARTLLHLLAADAEFVVTYESPHVGGTRTATFYCSERNADYLKRIRGVKWWNHMKFTLTEC